MSGVFGLTKIVLSLASLGGTLGGGSFGLLTLLEREQKANLSDVGNTDKSEEAHSLSSENSHTSQELPSESLKTVSRTSRSTQDKNSISPNSIISEYAYISKEEKDKRDPLSCEKLRGTMIGEFMWEEECKSFFESLWNGQVKDAPQRIFKIQEEKVFETLSFYLRESERSVNDNFIEQLKDGVNFERGFCRSQGEPKNGKLVVFCNPKNVSEQKQ